MVVVTEVKALHPFAFVTVTVNVDAVFTEMVCVVAPVDQTQPANIPALRVVEPPAQKERFPLIEGVGNGFTMVVAEAEPEQPFPSVTVTVNVDAVLTEMVCVVAPVDQTQPANIPALRVVELPEQKERLPVIDGVGLGLMIVVTVAESLQPFAFVTVTLKVPAVVTDMVCVVADVDQRQLENPAPALRVV